MKFSLISILAGLGLALSVGACTKSGHPSASSVPPSAQAQGTGDSGGGNSYKGRPLESYIRDVTTLPTFQSQLGLVMKSLEDRDPGLAKIIHSILKKNWYFIRGDLQGLPQGKIGSAVPTEQVALQTFQDVWINTDLFDPMKPEDQGKLILHEILMGLRLMKLDSDHNQCLMGLTDPADCQGESTLGAVC